MKPIEFLEIDPTVRCNFSCAYCRGRAMKQVDMEPEMIESILGQFPETRFVELHGEGDPLMHPRFFEMAGILRDRGIRVSIFTNGSFFSPRNVERLLDLELEKIVVSVDSADPERFREVRTGNLAAVRSGIERLVRRRRERGLSRPAIGIAASIQRRYLHDLAGLVPFYHELELDGGIGYQPLNPSPHYSWVYPSDFAGQFLSLVEMNAHVDELCKDPKAREAFRGVSSHRGFFDELFEPIERGERVCPWLERGAYITATGKITPCCMVPESEAIGSVGGTPAGEIFERREELRAQLSQGMVPRICEGCEVAAIVTRPAPQADSRPASTRAVPAPLVSVIIPCYNLGEFVEEAIESVHRQTCRDFEIIVIDDGSTDPGTASLLDGIPSERARVIRTENRGLPAARNHAIGEARGRYIVALDADDRLHPSFLEKTTAVLEARPDVAFVSTWLEAFGIESFVWRQDRCDFPRLLAECVVLTASPVRREVLEEIGGYDAVRFRDGDEDWDLWISIVEKGHQGAIVPEVLFYYRQRPGSMRRTCGRGPVRLGLFRSLVEKHASSYARWLPEVLLHRETECGRLLRENLAMENELALRIDPAIEARRSRRDSLLEELNRIAPLRGSR